MYKILIKYTSTSNKTYWQSHETILEDGTSAEFSTSDITVLKNELKVLDSQYGFNNIRVINDVTYDISVDVFDDMEDVETHSELE